ncbi:hypothetical protein ACFODW_08090 [Virgibacillus sediminis]|uniref:DUF2238 domain-containing protein n=1 Tax=Virgibacillus sediminis TaxID=202260 RepID=A0ABV7A5I1_9BACI
MGIWILLCIIFAEWIIHLYFYSFSAVFLLIIGGAIYLLGKCRSLVYHLFSSFTLMIGYSAVRYWEQITPVWFILPRYVIYSFLLTFLVLLMVKDFYSQIGVCLLGTSFGEILFHITVGGYGFQMVIGEMAFLDLLLCSLGILTGIHLLKIGRAKLYASLHTKHSMEVAK